MDFHTSTVFRYDFAMFLLINQSGMQFVNLDQRVTQGNISEYMPMVFVCVHLYVYPRERYALIVTPLLVHAQRKLLERISSFGGPAVPQPHHVKTQKATGKEVAHTHIQNHVQASYDSTFKIKV